MFILYIKKPIQLETLHIVQYLHFHGVCLQQYLNANIRMELRNYLRYAAMDSNSVV